MKTKKGKIALKALIASLAIAALVVIVWAAVPPYPTVDGMLSGGNESEEEYDYPGGAGLRQGTEETFSYCYGRYIGNQGTEHNGFYICNDWYAPEENYDPDEGCNAVNMFWWTELESPFNQYWRVVLHPDETCTLWEKYNNATDNWEIVDTSGWDVATGYNTSCNNPDVEHPIWELRIPPEHCTADVMVGAVDPKSANLGDCPPTEPNDVLGQNNGDPIDPDYGRPPDWDSEDFPNWGDNECE